MTADTSTQSAKAQPGDEPQSAAQSDARQGPAVRLLVPRAEHLDHGGILQHVSAETAGERTRAFRRTFSHLLVRGN